MSWRRKSDGIPLCRLRQITCNVYELEEVNGEKKKCVFCESKENRRSIMFTWCHTMCLHHPHRSSAIYRSRRSQVGTRPRARRKRRTAKFSGLESLFRALSFTWQQNSVPCSPSYSIILSWKHHVQIAKVIPWPFQAISITEQGNKAIRIFIHVSLEFHCSVYIVRSISLCRWISNTNTYAKASSKHYCCG